MNAFVINKHRVTKRLLVDALHALGLRGNSTTARVDLFNRLKHYLEANGLTVTQIKKQGIVSARRNYSDELLTAYRKVEQLEQLSGAHDLICSWFIKRFHFSNAVVPANELGNNKIIIVPEETPLGAMKSLIEKGV